MPKENGTLTFTRICLKGIGDASISMALDLTLRSFGKRASGKDLDEHRVGNIDFLSLDVEGYELNVLKGLDFECYRLKYILFEARYRDEIDSYPHLVYGPAVELFHHDILYYIRE